MKGRVFITGAAAGIGACTAKEFAKAGWELVLTDRDAGGLESTAAGLRADGTVVHTRVVDVTDREAVRAAAAWATDELGGVDILINNAGIGYSGELADTDMATWERLMAVNFWGPLYHIEAFLPSMTARGKGGIVNVSSGQAFFRMPTWGAYAAIKLALGAVSEILHYELRGKGVRVTTVYPFMVNTGFYSDVKSETWAQRMSMKLVPYYSQSPETVGRIIYKAAMRGKRVEMVNPINRVMAHVRSLPIVPEVITQVTTWLLTKGKDASPAKA